MFHDFLYFILDQFTKFFRYFLIIQIEVPAGGAVDGEETEAGGNRIPGPVCPTLQRLRASRKKGFFGDSDGGPKKFEVLIDDFHQFLVQARTPRFYGLSDDLEINREGMLRDQFGVANQAMGRVVINGTVIRKTILPGDFAKMGERVLVERFLFWSHHFHLI